ncbi:MAG: hypothetical protein ABIM99_01095 [Candidatus Dojkabacteria bacterium]
MKNEKEQEYTYDRIAHEIISDINVTMGSSAVLALSFILMTVLIADPTIGFEELSTKLKISVPIVSTLLSSLLSGIYHVEKFYKKKSLRTYVQLMLRNNEVNASQYFTGLNKFSLIKIFAILRSHLDHSGFKDESDYLAEMVSKILES